MLATTHVIVSLLIIQILALDRNETFMALMFGVFIDVDHLFGLGNYAGTKGIASVFDFNSMMHAGGQWKSMMHNPMAVMIVGPVSIASRLAIPLLFWSLHISMDFLEKSILGNFSSAEATLCILAGIALVGLRYAKTLESQTIGLLDYFKKELNWLGRSFACGFGRSGREDAPDHMLSE